MLDNLRKPFFFVALAALALTVLVELASASFLGDVPAGGQRYSELGTPGYGIPYLALLDGILLFTLLLNASPLLITDRIHGRIQGIATLIFSLIMLIAAIGLIVLAIVLLTVMVSLLVAVPFGTVIYVGLYGSFEVGEAAATLTVLMTLKLVFAVCLVLAHQGFLQIKGLVLLVLSSLLANVIVSFLHGLFPRLLVSITDNIAAIIVAVLAAIWALVFLIGSIPAVGKVLRADRAFA
jgi:hypothetical protein